MPIIEREGWVDYLTGTPTLETILASTTYVDRGATSSSTILYDLARSSYEDDVRRRQMEARLESELARFEEVQQRRVQAARQERSSVDEWATTTGEPFVYTVAPPTIAWYHQYQYHHL